jgi:hypothetical protein
VSANLEGCDAAGFVHRETAAACEPPLRDAEWVPELPPGAGVEDLPQCTRVEYAECRLVLNDCTRDADCPGSALCLREARMSDDGLELHISHYCHSPCRADADCSTDEICVCDPRTQNATLADVEVGACVPATCKTDADCSDATEQRFCISPFTHGRLRRESTPAGTTDYRFYCQTPNDECHGPETCTIETGPIDCCPAAICEYDVDRFQCRTVDMCTLCSLDAG